MSRSLSLAIYAAAGLGDALLASQLAHQFTLKGHHIVLYSSVLASMSHWFPSITVKPFPPSGVLEEELSLYDHVIAADHTVLVDHRHGNLKLTVLLHKEFCKRQTMLNNLLAYGHRVWNLSKNPEKPYQLPRPLQHRYHAKRVVIHPTSGAEKKNWSGEKFVRLGKELQKLDYDPVFIVSSGEAAAWRWVEERGIRLEVTETLDELASFLYESGYFIGNDSGAGHMASLFRVPTITVGARRRVLRLWRPGWGPGVVVTPWLPLPGLALKERHWKQLLTVGQVLRAFHKLARVFEK